MKHVDPPCKMMAPQPYRCVHENGAPIRAEPSLASAPIGRIVTGAVVTVMERYLNAEHQMFLKLGSNLNPVKTENQVMNIVDGMWEDKWVIETTTCCASVMIKCKMDRITH